MTIQRPGPQDSGHSATTTRALYRAVEQAGRAPIRAVAGAAGTAVAKRWLRDGR